MQLFRPSAPLKNTYDSPAKSNFPETTSAACTTPPAPPTPPCAHSIPMTPSFLFPEITHFYISFTYLYISLHIFTYLYIIPQFSAPPFSPSNMGSSKIPRATDAPRGPHGAPRGPHCAPRGFRWGPGVAPIGRGRRPRIFTFPAHRAQNWKTEFARANSVFQFCARCAGKVKIRGRRPRPIGATPGPQRNPRGAQWGPRGAPWGPRGASVALGILDDPMFDGEKGGAENWGIM